MPGTGNLFSALTVGVLDDLSDMLDSAIYRAAHAVPSPGIIAMLAELRETQHEVWHFRCELSGCRCLHLHPGDEGHVFRPVVPA